MGAKIDRSALKAAIASVANTNEYRQMLIENSNAEYRLKKNLISAQRGIVECLVSAFKTGAMASSGSSGGSVPSVIESLTIAGDSDFIHSDSYFGGVISPKVVMSNSGKSDLYSYEYMSNRSSENENRISVYTNNYGNKFSSQQNNRLVVSVYMTYAEDTYRPSLREDKYGGVFDIVSLFNTGYSKDSIKYVTGEYKGNIIHAKPYRPRTNFMEIGVQTFNMAYGTTLGVVAQLIK